MIRPQKTANDEKDNITRNVKALYEEYSFPRHTDNYTYDPNFFRQFFPEEILNKMKTCTALDAGCGTGPNLPSLSSLFKQVYAFDLSETSAKNAKVLAQRMNLKNVTITSGDIFNIPFDRKFDFIFSIGVLHHTKDARGGFHLLSQHLEKGGYITVALYNRFGGWKHRLLMRFFNRVKDPKRRLAFVKRFKAYRNLPDESLADGFIHPQITFFSIDQVLKWFKENNLEFISVSKPVNFLELYKHYENRNIKGHKNIYRNLSFHLKRIISQFIWGFHSSSGYYNIIGRKIR